MPMAELLSALAMYNVTSWIRACIPRWTKVCIAIITATTKAIISATTTGTGATTTAPTADAPSAPLVMVGSVPVLTTPVAPTLAQLTATPQVQHGIKAVSAALSTAISGGGNSINFGSYAGKPIMYSPGIPRISS